MASFESDLDYCDLILESKNLENKLLLRIKQASNLLDRISKVNVEGISRLSGKIKKEAQFLSKLQKSGRCKNYHLNCSNLKHLEAVVHELLNNEAICVGVMVCKIFTDQSGRTRKLCVDLILQNGRLWVKVVARNPKALTLVSVGEGYYGEKSIVEQGEEFVKCAEQHPKDYALPTVAFSFAHGIDDELAADLKAVGVHVQDARANSLLQPLERLSLSACCADPIESITRLNLCTTTMVAYVSAMSNGGSLAKFPNKLLNQHANEETLHPVKPVLEKLFQGKQLFSCRTAVESFQSILKTLGGPEEKKRAESFLKRVTIVADSISDKLSQSARVKLRSMAIFGTGDALKAVTTTANEAFIRTARQQGVDFVVHIHGSRPLSELKEIHDVAEVI